MISFSLIPINQDSVNCIQVFITDCYKSSNIQIIYLIVIYLWKIMHSISIFSRALTEYSMRCYSSKGLEIRCNFEKFLKVFFERDIKRIYLLTECT